MALKLSTTISPQSQILLLPKPNPKPKPYLPFHSKPPMTTLSLPSKSTSLRRKPPIIRSSLIPAPTILTCPPPPLSTILTTLLSTTKLLVSKAASLSLHDLRLPLVALAAGVGKWLDLYNSVLMVRVLLNWFPNLPWEIQPFSAIRSLCDPFLIFCRTILPPRGKIDVSPLVGFLVLGVLSSILGKGATA